MSTPHRGLLLFLFGASSSVALADVNPVPRQADEDIEICARIVAVARDEAFGFSHIVLLRNTCDELVVCEVWTDVDPLPRQVLRANPGGTDQVVIRRGSTTNEFTAGSSCHFE